MIGVIVATFLISMGCAYAYFTATTNKQQDSVSTAVIRVGFTDSTTIQNVSNPYIITERVYPGSTITITGAVQNTGTYTIWVILELQVMVDEDMVEQSFYTATGAMLERNNGSYTTSATQINESSNSQFSLTYSLSHNYDNTYMNQPVTVSVVAHAIQYANITGVEAVNIMLGTN